MLSLLVDNDWIRNHRVVEPPNRNSPRLVTYGAAIALGVLLIVGGIALATTVLGTRSDPPPVIKQHIRLM